MSSLCYLDLTATPGLRMVEMQMWMGNMRDLRELILDGVDMSRVDNALSTMYSPARLQMSLCELFGEIPPSLANLANLTHLDISRNLFKGSIPSALLSLPRLQQLVLYLSSSLPQHSSSLHTLDLSDTKVGGSIPMTMANLTALEELYLCNTNLRGPIPSFGEGSPLAYIDFSYTQLDGHIPPSIAQLLHLKWLCLSNNKLEGKIPPSIWKCLSLQRLDLSNDKLEGDIPLNISNLSELKDLYLQSNQLSGNFSDSHLHNLSRLVNVDISDNMWTVEFSPTWIPKFYLKMLRISSCNMKNRFPTFLITLYEVEDVDLSHSGLAGEIPWWIWGLDFLQQLNLSHNTLQGFYLVHWSEWII